MKSQGSSKGSGHKSVKTEACAHPKKDKRYHSKNEFPTKEFTTHNHTEKSFGKKK